MKPDFQIPDYTPGCGHQPIERPKEIDPPKVKPTYAPLDIRSPEEKIVSKMLTEIISRLDLIERKIGDIELHQLSLEDNWLNRLIDSMNEKTSSGEKV